MKSLREPIDAIFVAARNLAAAAEAHLAGRAREAEELFLAADCLSVQAWTEPGLKSPHIFIKDKHPQGDTRPVPASMLALPRHPNASVRRSVLARDGYRCRYCGIPVVSAEVRKAAHALYPQAVRWSDNFHHRQHAGFQCLWLQFDHVVPHSHGGTSGEDNVVVSCALCNFGKWDFTLRQLGLEDPRDRDPVPTDWNGLESLIRKGGARPASQRSGDLKPESPAGGDNGSVALSPHQSDYCVQAFFIAGAWIRNGYVYTPELMGKARWFRISDRLAAEEFDVGGIAGVRLRCAEAEITKRGLDPAGLRGPTV